MKGLLWIAFMERRVTNWWKNPDRAKVSQTKIAVAILFADAASAASAAAGDAAAATGHNNIIQGL